MQKPQAAQVVPAKKAAAVKAASSSRISRPHEETPRAPKRENINLENAPERIRAADSIRGPPDELVPDPVVAKEFGTTLMGLWRWDHDAELRELGWRPPVKIRNRNHRVRRFLEEFKAALIRKSIEERGQPNT